MKRLAHITALLAVTLAVTLTAFASAPAPLPTLLAPRVEAVVSVIVTEDTRVTNPAKPAESAKAAAADAKDAAKPTEKPSPETKFASIPVAPGTVYYVQKGARFEIEDGISFCSTLIDSGDYAGMRKVEIYNAATPEEV